METWGDWAAWPGQEERNSVQPGARRQGRGEELEGPSTPQSWARPLPPSRNPPSRTQDQAQARPPQVCSSSFREFVSDAILTTWKGTIQWHPQPRAATGSSPKPGGCEVEPCTHSAATLPALPSRRFNPSHGLTRPGCFIERHQTTRHRLPGLLTLSPEAQPPAVPVFIPVKGRE